MRRITIECSEGDNVNTSIELDDEYGLQRCIMLFRLFLGWCRDGRPGTFKCILESEANTYNNVSDDEKGDHMKDNSNEVINTIEIAGLDEYGFIRGMTEDPGELLTVEK